MSNKSNATIATMGIDIGKNSFHIVGLDRRGAIVLRQKWSRGQVEARLANIPPCLIGMEACVGAHHLSRRLQSLGHDVRLMPARYVRAYLKGQKNDFRDGEAIAEAVQRPTMKFVGEPPRAAPLPGTRSPPTRKTASRAAQASRRRPAIFSSGSRQSHESRSPPRLTPKRTRGRHASQMPNRLAAGWAPNIPTAAPDVVQGPLW